MWAWEDELGEAGPVTKGLLNHLRSLELILKIRTIGPGCTEHHLENLKNQLMPKPHPDFILREGEAWVLVFFKDAPGDSHVRPGLSITALGKRSAVSL